MEIKIKKPVPYLSTKHYDNFPCAHRQWKHPGVCQLIHGYSRSFTFTFGSWELDECGFVVDFGSLKAIKQYLEETFDHKLLLNKDDPLLPAFRALEKQGACQITLMPHGVSMEGTAQQLCEVVSALVKSITDGRCWVVSVESRENSKNSGIYLNPKCPFPRIN